MQDIRPCRHPHFQFKKVSFLFLFLVVYGALGGSLIWLGTPVVQGNIVLNGILRNEDFFPLDTTDQLIVNGGLTLGGTYIENPLKKSGPQKIGLYSDFACRTNIIQRAVCCST